MPFFILSTYHRHKKCLLSPKASTSSMSARSRGPCLQFQLLGKLSQKAHRLQEFKIVWATAQQDPSQNKDNKYLQPLSRVILYSDLRFCCFVFTSPNINIQARAVNVTSLQTSQDQTDTKIYKSSTQHFTDYTAKIYHLHIHAVHARAHTHTPCFKA